MVDSVGLCARGRAGPSWPRQLYAAHAGGMGKYWTARSSDGIRVSSACAMSWNQSSKLHLNVPLCVAGAPLVREHVLPENHRLLVLSPGRVPLGIEDDRKRIDAVQITGVMTADEPMYEHLVD